MQNYYSHPTKEPAFSKNDVPEEAMDFENLMLPEEFPAVVPTKSYDGSLPQSMSMKYAELYAVPKDAQHPEFYVNPSPYGEALFPLVDVPDIIPNPIPDVDFKHQAQMENQPQSTSVSGSEMDYLFSDIDNFDLSALLSLPAPANKVGELSFSSGGDPLTMCGFQPPLEELGMWDSSAVDSTLPNNIHYWDGVEKEGSGDTCKHLDPVIASSYGAEQGEDDASVAAESILESTSEMSPVNSEPSLISPTPRPSPRAPEGWEKSLRDLFERTFDMSDIQEDYMLPPPNKRQEPQLWSPKEKPPSPPPAKQASPPRVKQIGSPQDSSVKHKVKSKAKPTLLFGKHEDEIIHKLLATDDGATSKPVTRDKLITMPVEEFNQLLDGAKLTEIEVAFMKEWRRRGKNKAAAQVARKRKREEVSGLDGQVEKMRQQKVELEKKYDQLRSLVESLKERSRAAEEKLLQKQSKSLMEPISRDTHLIHVTDNEKLLLIPRISSKVLLVNS